MQTLSTRNGTGPEGSAKPAQAALMMPLFLDTKPIIDVVDDDPSVLRGLERLLRAYQVTVRTFSSASAFLKSIGDPPPHCLILDVQMPEMSGLDLQAKLGSLGLRVPIIFITAHEDAKAEQLALSRGAQAFLYKPLRAKVLWEAIAAALGPNPRPQQG